MAVSAKHLGYKAVKHRQEVLVGLIGRQRAILTQLGQATGSNNLERLEQRVNSEAFRIMVLGVFKAGKSTFINAMLGQKVLPAFAVPTTAIINEINWADEPRAMLYPLGGKPPVAIAVDELERHIVIDEEDDQRPNPYERAEISWPLALCRDGVVVIDSPGLEEDPDREAITRRYLGRADAVVFMFGNRGKLSLSERSFFKAAIQPTHEDGVFFVCNRINEVEPEERERTIRVTKRALEEFVSREDRLFFIDARGALRARLDGAEPQLQASNVPAVEKALERFLATERGRIKIITPARQLQQSIHESRRAIQSQQAMLDTELDALRRRYDEARQPLDNLERERQLIVRQVEVHLQGTQNKVAELTRRFLTYTADRCAQWAEEIDPHTKPGLNPATVQKQQKQMVTEIAEQFGERIQDAVLTWQEDELQPLVEQRAAELEQQLQDRVSRFSDRLDELRVDLSGVVGAIEIDNNGPKALERVLSSAAALVLVDVGSAYIGGHSGFKPMVKSLLPQIAVGVAGLALGLGPIALPALLLSSAVLRVVLGSKRAVRDTAKQVGEQVARELRERTEDEVAKIANTVGEQLTELQTAIDRGLEAQLQSVHEEVQTVLAEKAKGEQSSKARHDQLETAERDLNELDKQLSELIVEAALR